MTLIHPIQDVSAQEPGASLLGGIVRSHKVKCWDSSNYGIMGKADTHVHTKYSGIHRMGVLRFPESVSEPRDVIVRARSAGMDVNEAVYHGYMKDQSEKYAGKAGFDQSLFQASSPNQSL